MAKGKRAAALFEVIQAAKEKEQLRATGGGFLTPSWWFKGKAVRSAENEAAAKRQAKKSPFAKPAVAPPPPVVETIEEPAPSIQEQEPEIQESEISETDPMNVAAEETPTEETSAPVVDEVVDNEEPAMDEPQAEPEVQAPVIAHREIKAPVKETPVVSIKSSSRAARRAIDVGVDKFHQLISFRMSFTSAAITSFGFIVVLALAFLLGKSLGHGPSQAGASSIEAVKNGPSFPGVINVTQGKQTTHDGPPIAVNIPSKNPPKQITPQAETKQAAIVAPPAAAQAQTSGIAPNGKRIVGMQYVWVRSYPDPLDADDARDALVKAGIDCTVEKGLWLAPAWSSVVGTRGFDHTHNNPEFDAYIKSIRDVSNSLPPDGKILKFDPRVVGWKDQGH